MINSPQNACMSCFAQHATPTNPCPVCGYNEVAQEMPPHLLRPRTILNGKYLLGKVLGQGGFGITYIGWDLNLDIKVAIKEYYPSGFVSRETTSVGSATVQPFTGSQGDFFLRGREKFINEAKTLAKFFALPGIVSIKDYFQENGTAYISMEYIDGQTLKDYLEQMSGRLPADQVFDMMKPVMYSLAEVHKAGLIHRDISPDNIMISKEGQMKLLDFGAARDFSGSGNQSMSIMLKPGFAPEEQYRSRGVQGPWTDVYALSATIYRCITGVTPEESVERVRADHVRPPSMLGIPVNPAQEAALMRGMAVQQDNRYQSVTELYYALYESQSGVSAVTANVSAVTPSAAVPISITPQQYQQSQPQYQAQQPQQPSPQQQYHPQQQQPQQQPIAKTPPKKKRFARWTIGQTVMVCISVLVITWFIVFPSGLTSCNSTVSPNDDVIVTVSPPISPEPTSEPTPEPTPEIPSGDILEGTTWELFEIIAEGITIGKDYLDREGLSIYFIFGVNREVTGIIEGEAGHGTYRISGSSVFIEIEDETTEAFLDGDVLTLDVDEMIMRFRPTNEVISVPGLNGHSDTQVLTAGNTAANINNWGIVAMQDDRVYFSLFGDAWFGIFLTSKLDGSDRRVISRDTAHYINVVGDWLYYENTSEGGAIYRIKTDGSEREALNAEASRNVTVVGDWIYYINFDDDRTIYRMKTDGSEREKLNNDTSSFINVVGDWIYYSNNDEGNNIFRISTDGTKRERINSVNSSYINVVDDWIYFRYWDVDTGIGPIHRVRIDGSSMERINDDNSMYINVVGDWIYYRDNWQGVVCRIRTDGTDRQELNDVASSSINAVGDWIYYTFHENGRDLYRMRTDGTENQLID